MINSCEKRHVKLTCIGTPGVHQLLSFPVGVQVQLFGSWDTKITLCLLWGFHISIHINTKATHISSLLLGWRPSLFASFCSSKATRILLQKAFHSQLHTQHLLLVSDPDRKPFARLTSSESAEDSKTTEGKAPANQLLSAAPAPPQKRAVSEAAAVV